MLKARRKVTKVNGPRQNRNTEMVLYRRPPMIDLELKQNVRLRFTSVAAVIRNSVSWADLTDLFVVAQTAVLGSKLFNFVKIKYVEIWDDDVIGSTATVSITFDNTEGNQADPRKVYSDTSMGVEPAHVLARPNKDSLASKWHLSNANNAFEITVTAGAIIDVGLSFRNQSGTAVAVQNALVGATPGAIYYRGLDGLAVATTNFLPPQGIVRI
jgi:hypothetical protein